MTAICRSLLNFCVETSRLRTKVRRPREFHSMELHEVCHARRRLAGELEVVLAHPVIAPLLVELGHHREVVDDMVRQARRAKLFAPLGSRRVTIADRPAKRLGEDARIVVQVGRLRPGQIVDVTNVRRRVVKDRLGPLDRISRRQDALSAEAGKPSRTGVLGLRRDERQSEKGRR